MSIESNLEKSTAAVDVSAGTPDPLATVVGFGWTVLVGVEKTV